MLGPRTSRRIVAALVAPCLLLVGTGTARAMFRCPMDDVARDACCCPDRDAPAPGGAPGVAFNRSCCDVELRASQAATDARAQVERFDPSRLLALAIAVVLAPAAPSLDPPARAIAFARALHPPAGPPLLLRKRSFLI